MSKVDTIALTNNTENTIVVYHAWYSSKQESIRRGRYSYKEVVSDHHKCPGCIYWTTKSGAKLETTMVTKSRYHNCNEKYLDDLIYQGEVLRYGGICRW